MGVLWSYMAEMHCQASLTNLSLKHSPSSLEIASILYLILQLGNKFVDDMGLLHDA